MILRHFTKKKSLDKILEDGHLKSLKDKESERGRIYFEEYKDNDHLLKYILSDSLLQGYTKNDYVSLFFDSDILEKNGIKVEISTGFTKKETEIGISIGSITKEEQSRIGDYYIVLDQFVPLKLCTDSTQKLLQEFQKERDESFD